MRPCRAAFVRERKHQTMPSEGAFVWVWLPDATTPLVAGRIEPAGADRWRFFYGESYLARDDARPLYLPELALQRGFQEPPTNMAMASCLRNAAPDAWGRRVILNHLAARGGVVNELTFLLQSGSDRPGALDFQASSSEYVAREASPSSVDVLAQAAGLVEAGMPLPAELDTALLHGSSIGGARPKALLVDGSRKLIAKFSTSSDLYDVVGAEFVAMRLAALSGIDAAPVQLLHSAGRPVLLVERFDRIRAPDGWQRKAMVSALTILGLDEMEARYASYAELAEEVRRRFHRPKATLKELFRRIVFNVLVGNTDDHARNHSAFWDGEQLTLTPAYDICPQMRTGGEASQAMLIHEGLRDSRITTCLAASRSYGLCPADAALVVERQLLVLREHWDPVIAEAGMTVMHRKNLMGRQFLNPAAFDGLDGALPRLAAEIRDRP